MKHTNSLEIHKKKGPTPLMVRSQLLLQGYTIQSWAKEHGYSQQHVSKALHRWLHRQYGEPRGHTLCILRGISRATGIDIPVAPIEQ